MAKNTKNNNINEFMPAFLKDAPSKSWRALYKWGDREKFYAPSSRSRLYGYMRDQLGLNDDFFTQPNYMTEVVDAERFATGLDNKDVDKLRQIVGESNVAIDADSRLIASITKDADEAEAIRRGEMPAIVDAVVYPQSEAEIVDILAYAKKRKITVTVRSSLLKKEYGKKTIALDFTHRFNKILALNEVDSYATIEAGMYLPVLENILNNAPDNFKDYNIENKFTVGHFPLEYEECTIYDAAINKPYGSHASYYGTFNDIVMERRYLTADGATNKWEDGAVLASVKLSIAKYYPHNNYGFSYVFRNYQEAVNAMREIYSKGGVVPIEMRLSDEVETSLLMRYYLLDDSMLDGYLKMRHAVDGSRCMLVGFSGGPYTYSRLAFNMVKSIARKYKGISTTSFIADAYNDSRYQEMYVREAIADFGISVSSEYYEFSWSELPDRRRELVNSDTAKHVRSRIISASSHGVVLEVVTIKA